MYSGKTSKSHCKNKSIHLFSIYKNILDKHSSAAKRELENKRVAGISQFESDKPSRNPSSECHKKAKVVLLNRDNIKPKFENLHNSISNVASGKTDLDSLSLVELPASQPSRVKSNKADNSPSRRESRRTVQSRKFMTNSILQQPIKASKGNRAVVNPNTPLKKKYEEYDKRVVDKVSSNF